MQTSEKRGIMNEYDYQEVVDRVDGLNSVSTLKKWRLKIESLTGTQFKESRVRTGRKSYSKVYLFTEDDLNHFKRLLIRSLRWGWKEQF